MTELDQALGDFRGNPGDAKYQSQFYDLFLNTVFYVPTVKEKVEIEESGPEEDVSVPMIVEVDGLNYLMLFDTEPRLKSWAEKDVPFLTVHGHMISEFSAPDLYWAMNVGTEHAKQFVPEEIVWIKSVVGQCKTEIGKQVGESED
ncbi:MAG: SseB family protein [Desulfuromonadales bacterium]|jgi:hypothetical protein|nr:SseB family protein [Desulfuromonadales bacterium]